MDEGLKFFKKTWWKLCMLRQRLRYGIPRSFGIDVDMDACIFGGLLVKRGHGDVDETWEGQTNEHPSATFATKTPS